MLRTTKPGEREKVPSDRCQASGYILRLEMEKRMPSEHARRRSCDRTSSDARAEGERRDEQEKVDAKGDDLDDETSLGVSGVKPSSAKSSSCRGVEAVQTIASR
jgi:hypothetical protein